MSVDRSIVHTVMGADGDLSAAWYRDHDYGQCVEIRLVHEGVVTAIRLHEFHAEELAHATLAAVADARRHEAAS